MRRKAKLVKIRIVVEVIIRGPWVAQSLKCRLLVLAQVRTSWFGSWSPRSGCALNSRAWLGFSSLPLSCLCSRALSLFLK